MLETIVVLYRLRDEVLSSTVAGAELIEVYYEHSPRVAYLFTQDPLLRRSARRFLEAAAPMFESLLDKKGGLRLSVDFIDQVDVFMSRLSQADLEVEGGGNLASDIDRVREMIKLDSLADLPVREAWSIVNESGFTQFTFEYEIENWR